MFDDEDDYDFNDPGGNAELTARERAESFIRTAVLFESALAFVAVALGWMLDVPAWVSASGENGSVLAVLGAIGLGTVATLPLLVAFLALQYSSIPSMEELQEFMERQIVPLFREASVVELGLISLAAGLGEEALFRGVVQGYLQTLMGTDASPVVPILISSLLFGLAHYVTKEYLLISALMGAYLGLWFWWTGDLIVPIVIHALYDWFALIYLRQMAPTTDQQLD